MGKKAFTMIELVLVIVVLGILAALAIPRMERDLRQEAADNVLSAIRYTQHLALVDDKHKFDNPKWQERFWHIVFGSCTGSDKYYMVGSDDDMTGSTNAYFTQNEAALDPTTGKPMFWTNGVDCSNGGDSTVSASIFISKKYGINSIGTSGGCGNLYLGFDHLGRPYGDKFPNSGTPDYNGTITGDCNITFGFSDSSITDFSIIIKKETGYAYIDKQPGS
ncbi:type II secretion system protein [Sulfurovum sp.]|uniref:type II secretion system protein n=1 Tax=Sulfurovum sp. TaxID=1969726 RepID=UPI0025CF83BE|nr:type II secretion system protein [Sulfurovum sp.]